jgi:hypothetical protein
MGSEFRNLKVESVSSPRKVGEYTIISCSYEYRGDAIQKVLYAAIGNAGAFGFNEIVADQITRNIPACATWTKLWASVWVTITDAVNPAGSPYDVYAKLIGGPGNDIISPTRYDILTVQGSGLPDPEFRNLVVESVTSPVTSGSVCTIRCKWDYRGPSIIKTIYAAIGNAGAFGFNEIIYNLSPVTIPECPDWVNMWFDLNVNITAAINPSGSPYDVYCKLIDGPGNDLISNYRLDILVVSGPIIPDPEYRGLQIIGYDQIVDHGGYCNVQVGFQYRGPAGSATLYGALGNSGVFGFNEIVNGTAVLSLPESADWRQISGTVSIYVDTTISPEGSPYDLYTKLAGPGADVQSPIIFNAVSVTGEDPIPDAEFRNLSIVDYTPSAAEGGHFRIDFRFEYRGPNFTKTLYCAIGNNGALGMNEVTHSSKTINISQALDWEFKTASIDVPVNNLDPNGSPYDVYGKLIGAGNDIISPVLENVLTVEGGGYPEPEFQQLRVTDATSPVQIGGMCWIKVRFQYRGPVIQKTLYVAIGNSGAFGFGEIISAYGEMTLEPSADWADVDSEMAISITDAIDPEGSPYDVYAKITGPGNDLISPAVTDIVTVQPGNGEGGITGAITSIQPLTFDVASPIELTVSYNAYCDDPVQQVTGWETRITVNLDGLSDSITHIHTGQDGSQQDLVLQPGDMPDKTLSGNIILEGGGGVNWIQLHKRAITVSPPGSGPGEEGFDWGPVAIVGGLLLVAYAAGSTPKKKVPAKKK